MGVAVAGGGVAVEGGVVGVAGGGVGVQVELPVGVWVPGGVHGGGVFVAVGGTV